MTPFSLEFLPTETFARYIRMQQDVHGEGLMLYWKAPRSPQAVISATVYYHCSSNEKQ